MKKTPIDDELHQAILEVMNGRLAELMRQNRGLLSKLEAQLESNAYHVLKASAKEIEAVSRSWKEKQNLTQKVNTEDENTGRGD